MDCAKACRTAAENMTLANSVTTVTIHLADDPDRCNAPSNKGPVGRYSGLIVEGVLDTLLCVAVSDASALVPVCVMRSLGARYDAFLSQMHHLQPLFLSLRLSHGSMRWCRMCWRYCKINLVPASKGQVCGCWASRMGQCCRSGPDQSRASRLDSCL